MPERTPADCLARIQRRARTTQAERLRAGRHIAWPLEFNALGEWDPIYPHPDAPGAADRAALACGEPDGKPCTVPNCPWCHANQITTSFERMWGIPPERVGISRPTNRDLAVEARRGGRLIILMYRHAIYAPICPLLSVSEFGRRSDRDMARGVTNA
jgi:hypothetical protein